GSGFTPDSSYPVGRALRPTFHFLWVGLYARHFREARNPPNTECANCLPRSKTSLLPLRGFQTVIAPMPRCLIIAGPNGAGKTTFAREYLPHEIGVFHFVNSDLLAAGLAPLDPSSAQVAAGRLFLKEIDRLA